MEVWINRQLDGPADSYEYDVEVHDRTTILKFSNASDWVTPGAYAGGILDTGDGIEVELNNETIELGYHDAERILALLLAHYDGHMQIKETKIIKEI